MDQITTQTPCSELEARQLLLGEIGSSFIWLNIYNNSEVLKAAASQGVV
jgi:hypothetical protein